jgi:hypothetical protein
MDTERRAYMLTSMRRVFAEGCSAGSYKDDGLALFDELAVKAAPDNSARKDEIAKRTARQFSELVGSYQMRFQHEDALVALVKQALTSYEEAQTPPSAGEREAIRNVAHRAAYESVSRMSFLPSTFEDLTRCIGTALEFALFAAAKLRTPSGEGWQQRIAAIEPWRNDQQDDPYCVFCGVTRYRLDTATKKLVTRPHAPDCLWQDASNALKDE